MRVAVMFITSVGLLLALSNETRGQASSVPQNPSMTAAAPGNSGVNDRPTRARRFETPTGGPAIPKKTENPPQTYTTWRPVNTPCWACQGHREKTCPTCYGTGKNDQAISFGSAYIRSDQFAPLNHAILNYNSICLTCYGNRAVACNQCGGSGTIQNFSQVVTQIVPSGITAESSNMSKQANTPNEDWIRGALQKLEKGQSNSEMTNGLPRGPSRVLALMSQQSSTASTPTVKGVRGPEKEESQPAVLVSNQSCVLGSTGRYVRHYLTIKNGTKQAIQVDILHLSWLKGLTEFQGEDIVGPAETIFPGAEIFFTFAVNLDAPSEWTLDTPYKITAVKTTAVEIKDEEEKALKAYASQLKEIRIVNTKCVAIPGPAYSPYPMYTSDINVYNNNNKSCSDVVFQVFGFDSAKKIVEIRIVHFDVIETRNSKLHCGMPGNNEHQIYESVPKSGEFTASQRIDRYTARPVAVGKKMDGFSR